VETGKLAVVRCNDERFRERGNAFDSRGEKRVVQREHRSEGITVGIDVAGQRDGRRTLDGLGRPPERLLDLAHDSSSLPPPAAPASYFASASWWIPRRISSTRWPATMPGSTLNVRRGTWRMRTDRPSTPRRCEAPAFSAAAALSAADSSAVVVTPSVE